MAMAALTVAWILPLPSFPRRIEDRCTSYLLDWELPPLVALVEKYCWIMRMKISVHDCNVICQDMPSH